MKKYNGHRSWNAWNVSLWILNTENVYDFARQCIERAKPLTYERHLSKKAHLCKATRLFMADYRGQKTPDGAVYNPLSVRLCLETLIES